MRLTIGFIGAGSVARAIARSAVNQGHTVMLSSNHGVDTLQETLAEFGSEATAVASRTAATADIVVLAVPWGNMEQALADLPAWEDRILVDATNPFLGTAPDLVLADLGGVGASEIVARHAPGARVVKAFNSIRMSDYEAGPMSGRARRVLFVSGDHADAKTQIGGLIESFGFVTVDLGSLKDGGRMQQAGGPLAGRDFLMVHGLSE